MKTDTDNARLLVQAATRGDTDEVEHLTSIFNSKEHSALALCMAAENGHTECVKLLMAVSDPKAKDKDSCALRLAAMHGHTQCVKLLIPVSDTTANNILAIASSYGHVECIKLLIPVSDVKADDSSALFCAVMSGSSDCIDLLFDISDPHHVLQKLQRMYRHTPHRWQYLEEKIAHQQRDLIEQKVAEICYVATKQRKI